MILVGSNRKISNVDEFYHSRMEIGKKYRILRKHVVIVSDHYSFLKKVSYDFVCGYERFFFFVLPVE